MRPQTFGATVENRRQLRLEEERDAPQADDPARTSFTLGRDLTFSTNGLLRSFSFGNVSMESGLSSQNVGFAASGDLAIPRLSLFASGNIEVLNKDATRFADGFDSDILGVTVGGDYQIHDQALVGLAFTYTNTDADFDGGGGFETDSFNGTLFASFLPVSGLFVDVIVGYARKNYDVDRAVSFMEGGSGDSIVGTASSDTHGDIISAQTLVGYDYTIRNMTIGPRLGLNYTNTHVQDYKERGGTGLELIFQDQYVNSLQSTVGLQASSAFSTVLGVFVPQINADYVHEFANSVRAIEVQFAEDNTATPTRFAFRNEKPIRNFFNVGAGLVAVLPHNIQPFVNFRAMVGNKRFDNYAGSFGIRIGL